MSQKITVYHNPRCSKSRATVDWLIQQGADIEIIEYLKQPPNKATLQTLLNQLDMKADEILRKTEKTCKELGLHVGEHSEEDLLQAIVQHPILLERPIVSNGSEAVIGRPLDNVIELFDER